MTGFNGFLRHRFVQDENIARVWKRTFHVSLCAAFGVPSRNADLKRSGAALPACRESALPSRQTEARAQRTLDPHGQITLRIPRVAQRPGDASRRGNAFDLDLVVFGVVLGVSRGCFGGVFGGGKRARKRPDFLYLII